jgi:hypothetical protein
MVGNLPVMESGSMEKYLHETWVLTPISQIHLRPAGVALMSARAAQVILLHDEPEKLNQTTKAALRGGLNIFCDKISHDMMRVPRKTVFRLVVKRSASGLGVFTREPIRKRRFIIEYCGDLISDDEANRRGGKYLFNLGNGRTIDGKVRSNIARYLNHSCKPNCEIDIIGNKVFIHARRNIKAGEELTFDYGKEYFDFFIGKHCRCKKHAKD